MAVVYGQWEATVGLVQCSHETSVVVLYPKV